MTPKTAAQLERQLVLQWCALLTLLDGWPLCSNTAVGVPCLQVSFYIATQFNCAGTLKLSYDVASVTEISPCNKMDKPLVVYRFSGNAMTSVTTLRT